MSTQDYFDHKICLVTGAASGIGFAVSEALLECGAVVVMADRDTETLDSAVGKLGTYTGRVHPATVDVTRQEQVQRLIQGVAEQHGRLDVLFNNAGVSFGAPIETATLDQWRHIVDINLWGVIYGIDAALPIMRRQGSGHIVNTASIFGLYPSPFQSLYCTTKYAVVGLSESLRFELADQNIQVSVVCPGFILSRIYDLSWLGGATKVAPPADAIPADEAAKTILAALARQEGIIAFPEKYHARWRSACESPETFEASLIETARQRRESYLTKGTII